MYPLLDHLRRFNRKERFLLVGQALGNRSFRLGRDFAADLGQCVGRDVPAAAYCAMDYHLDWLYAALAWTYEDVDVWDAVRREFADLDPKTGKTADLKVTGNQSDVDLLIAWVDERDRGQVVLMEAKGYSPWDRRQMAYKCARLDAIFGSRGRRFPEVDAHLVLAGPPPGPTGKTLASDQWPSWARKSEDPGAPVKYFMPLDRPGYEAVAVERITRPAEDRKPSKAGSHWHIKQAKWPSAGEVAPGSE